MARKACMDEGGEDVERTYLTVRDIVAMVEGIAPADLAEPWDNAGLQMGAPQAQVEGVLLALDATLQVAREAKALGCHLIIAHHPVFFHGVKSLAENTPEGAFAAEMIRAGIALYTTHTALDKAPGGLGDALAARLGILDVRGEGFLRYGRWEGGNLGALHAHARAQLGVPGAVLYGHPGSPARSVALCSGSGMSYVGEARDVDVFITGDVTHHDALDALAMGVAVLDIGHRGGEMIAVELLERGLQNVVTGVQCPLRICLSVVDPYAIATGGP